MVMVLFAVRFMIRSWSLDSHENYLTGWDKTIVSYRSSGLRENVGCVSTHQQLTKPLFPSAIRLLLYLFFAFQAHPNPVQLTPVVRQGYSPLRDILQQLIDCERWMVTMSVEILPPEIMLEVHTVYSLFTKYSPIQNSFYITQAQNANYPHLDLGLQAPELFGPLPMREDVQGLEEGEF